MITVYSTPTCPRCKVLKAKLAQKNLEFNEVHDMDEMQSLGIMSVPQVKVDDNPLMDFSAAINWINSQED